MASETARDGDRLGRTYARVVQWGGMILQIGGILAVIFQPGRADARLHGQLDPPFDLNGVFVALAGAVLVMSARVALAVFSMAETSTGGANANS